MGGIISETFPGIKKVRRGIASPRRARSAVRQLLRAVMTTFFLSTTFI